MFSLWLIVTRAWQRGRAIALSGYFAIALCSGDALAQITPDETLGAEGSIVIQNVPVNGTLSNQIEGGAIRGANLFHSFREFNVGEGQRIYFANPVGIKNIFSRITGTDSSNILGILGVNGGANLFLLNPNGILFSKNASLDVRGSFIATTANAIQFSDRGFWSASTPEALTLLTVNPSAFLFNQIAAQPITNQARLRVREGRSLLLLGGEIVLKEGRLNASDGFVELGGVAGSGSVGLGVNGNELSLTFPDNVARANVSLTGRTKVDVNGEGGGFVRVWGDRVTLTDASEILAETEGSENGRGIAIAASQLILRDGSQISASALEGSQGNGGGIVVNASELVEVIGTSRGGGGRGQGGGSGDGEKPSKLASDAQGAGRAENLIINTRRLVVRDGARLSASTIDRSGGGSLIVNASESVEVTGTSNQRQRSSALTVQTRGVGQAGNLTINTGRLSVRDGAEISASTFGAGGGGNIIIDASESVEAIGSLTTRDGERLPSRIVADTGRSLDTRDVGTIVGTGKGGNLSINTGQLVVRDGAQVSVSGLSLDLERGDAGNLEVTAHSIRLDNEGAIAATTTSGNGGDLTLEAREALLLRRDSRISTTAGTAQAGGDGGNMTIDAELIIAIPNENSDITANAFLGQGGRINLTTQGIFGLEIRTREQLQTLLGTNDSTQLDPRQLPSNDITAISQTNPQLSGEIALQSPEVDPSQGLAELPADVVDGARLVEQNLCAASRDSAFTITGRGGLPAPPNETLHTDAAWEDWRITSESEESAGTLSTASVRASEATKNSQQRIVEAQGWYTDTNGNIVLTAEPMAVTPHETWLVSANCQELSHLHEEGVGN